MTRRQGLRTVRCGAKEAGARNLHSPSLRGFDGFQSPSCTMRRERFGVSKGSSIQEFDTGLGSTVRSAFDFSARVRLFESTSRTRVSTRALAAQPCLNLALAVACAGASHAQRRRSSYGSSLGRSS